MDDDKPNRARRSAARADATRRRVLDAAERLLHQGRAEFSMRDLAAEAGVSFATPFNHFGSKTRIMQALSAERIAAMTTRFDLEAPGGDAADRVLAAVEIAAGVMLASPAVNRAVIGSLGAPGVEVGQALAQSRALWTRAIGSGDGFDPDLEDLAAAALPGQLALAFRGVLSFWTAGEIADDALTHDAVKAAASLLLGFLPPERRQAILAVLRQVRSARAPYSAA